MKLNRILEATYAFPNYASWVQERIDRKRYGSLKFNQRDVGPALKQLTRKFGQPSHEHGDPDTDYYLWQNDADVDFTSYDIALWVSGELDVKVYKETDVD